MKRNKKYSKGITIVSLVITIILLLILAGISIQAITNTGLFEAAGQAKKEAKRAQVVEWLNLKLIEEQTYNPIGTSEQIIKATKLRVDNNKSELEKIGKTVIVEETKTEEDGEKVDIYFYVQVDEDVFKVEIKGSQFIGEAGKFPPIIKIESVTSTTNSITVTVSTKRNEGGNIEYYIKSEDEEKYTLKETTEDESYQFTGLEQNKNYSIKIVAIAENKQTAEVTKDVLLGSVTNLTDANIIFTYEPDSWTNGSVKVTAELKDMTSNYILKITDSDPVGASKATALGWADASAGITVDSNKTIYALLIDNEGQIGAAATGNVDKIDTQKPVARVSGTTTNSITFTGSDTAKTGESASGIAAYIVQESSTAPAANSTSWTSYNGTSKTVSGLTQGQTYNVFVKDNAGNVSAAASKGTGTVTNLTSANITFTYSPSSWTNGSVKVTATLSNNQTSSYTLKITDSNPVGASKQTALGWTNASTGITVDSNKTVYAVLVDNEGQIGEAAPGNVTNIDTTSPSNFTIEKTSVTANSFKLSAIFLDSNSGLGKIVWYYKRPQDNSWQSEEKVYTTLNGTTTGTTESIIKEYSVIGMTQGGEVQAYAIGYDVAGNAITTTNASSSNPLKFNTEKYTISYNLNGGTGTIADQGKWYGIDITLSSTEPSRSGYKFVGWATNNTATNPEYRIGAEYTTNSSNELYAVWQCLVSGITLNNTNINLINCNRAQESTNKTLIATISNASTAYNKNVEWSSSNENVAIVNDNGLVTPVNGGSCIITCAAKDGGGAKATCNVKVTKKTYLFYLGTDYSTVTGGWYQSYEKNASTCTRQFISGSYLKLTGLWVEYGNSGVVTKNKINFANYDKVYIDFCGISRQDQGTFRIGCKTTDTKETYTTLNGKEFITDIYNTSRTTVYSNTNYNESAYFGIYTFGADVNIYSLWLIDE